MSLTGQVSAAAQVGLLAAGTPGPEAALDALRLLRHVVPADASSIVALDESGKPSPVAALDYPAELADDLALRFPLSPWMQVVGTSHLPPSISTQEGQEFRRGAFFEQHIRPHGLRDGMTAELRCQGRRVGLVHMSATEDTFDQSAQELLAALTPVLGALIDVTGRLAQTQRVPAGMSAALLQGVETLSLPGRDRPEVLSDSAFCKAILALRSSPAGPHRGLWPTDAAWYRFNLTSVAALNAGEESILLTTEPIEPPYGLSPRELDVLTCLALGWSNARIANHLVISERTVHSHVEHILRKTGCASRALASALARQEALLSPSVC